MDFMPENISSFGGEIDSLWLLVTYFAVGWLILSMGAMFYFVFRFRRKEGQPAQSDLTVRITGKQWYWAFTHPGKYGVIGTEDDLVVNEGTESVLHVPVNKTVNVELTAVDVLHSFWVKELRLKQDTIPGRIINKWIHTIKPGQYELACAEICGLMHMIHIS